MNLADLFDNIEYESNFELCSAEINNITHDIKATTDKSLIVTFTSPSKISRQEAKAAALICNTLYKSDSTSFPTVYVKNPRLVYSLIASRLANIDYNTIKFIGVTGTNGKTSTATMIFEIMKSAGINVGMIGTGTVRYMDVSLTETNYSMTTPDPDMLFKSIKRMQCMGCKLIIMEVSSHSLALEKVAPITFEISVFTSLSSEHMDFHKSMEDYYKTKLTLFMQSKKGVFNADDSYSARAMRECESVCETSCIGIHHDADAMAKDISLNGLNGSSYVFRGQNCIFRVNPKLAGYHNIYNSMLAIKCAMEYGISEHIARNAIDSLTTIPGRCEIIHENPFIIIDYAHTEGAFENILKTIHSIKLSNQTLYTVFGCGGERDKNKRPKMARIAEKYSDKIIVTSDNPRNENPIEIIDDILKGIEDLTCRDVIPDRKTAIEYAIKKAKSNDIILILGKGHEQYVIDKDGYHFFNEREICSRILEERNN